MKHSELNDESCMSCITYNKGVIHNRHTTYEHVYHRYTCVI